MITFLITLAVLLVISALWIRFSPIDRDRWHVDPADTDNPGKAGLRLIGLEAPRFPADPDTVLTAIQEVARSEPGTRLIEGDADEGMLTFVARSKVIGLADLITVKAVSEGAATKLSVVSRARLGSIGHDWGTNSERLDRWLQDMRLRLGEA